MLGTCKYVKRMVAPDELTRPAPTRRRRFLRAFCRAPLVALALAAYAVRAVEPLPPAIAYTIQPGDVLTVSVWNEKDLLTDALVRPDGGLSFPLVGELQAAGRTIEDVRQLITMGLKAYLPQPVVSVALKVIGGNFVYVLGKVNKPGQFPFNKPIDVMQALSLAGGTTPYAAVDDIKILQRGASGLTAISFHYSDVAKGRNLAQDVLLNSGDTVVVP